MIYFHYCAVWQNEGELRIFLLKSTALQFIHFWRDRRIDWTFKLGGTNILFYENARPSKIWLLHTHEILLACKSTHFLSVIIHYEVDLHAVWIFYFGWICMFYCWAIFSLPSCQYFWAGRVDFSLAEVDRKDLFFFLLIVVSIYPIYSCHVCCLLSTLAHLRSVSVNRFSK